MGCGFCDNTVFSSRRWIGTNSSCFSSLFIPSRSPPSVHSLTVLQITGADVSPDGLSIITAHDGGLQVWDAVTGATKAVLSNQGKKVFFYTNTNSSLQKRRRNKPHIQGSLIDPFISWRRASTHLWGTCLRVRMSIMCSYGGRATTPSSIKSLLMVVVVPLMVTMRYANIHLTCWLYCPSSCLFFIPFGSLFLSILSVCRCDI